MATARSQTRYRRLLIWLALGLVMALLAYAYVATIRRAAELDAQRIAWQSIDWRVHRALRPHHGENVLELAKFLNHGEAFARRGTLTGNAWVKVEAATIIDCDPGWLVRLQISRSGLYAAQVVSPSQPDDELPTLMVGYADRCRKILAALSIVAWLAAMALLPGCGRWAGAVAQWCIGAALLCGLMCGLPFCVAGEWPRTLLNKGQLGGIVFMLVAPILFLMVHTQPLRNGCKRCGYNLKGNTSGICPECGTATVGSRHRQRSQQAAQYARALERLESARS